MPARPGGPGPRARRQCPAGSGPRRRARRQGQAAPGRRGHSVAAGQRPPPAALSGIISGASPADGRAAAAARADVGLATQSPAAIEFSVRLGLTALSPAQARRAGRCRCRLEPEWPGLGLRLVQPSRDSDVTSHRRRVTSRSHEAGWPLVEPVSGAGPSRLVTTSVLGPHGCGQSRRRPRQCRRPGAARGGPGPARATGLPH